MLLLSIVKSAEAESYATFQPQVGVGMLALGAGPIVGFVSTAGLDAAPRLRVEAGALAVAGLVPEETRYGLSGEAEISWPIPLGQHIRVGPAFALHAGKFADNSYMYGYAGGSFAFVVSVGPHDHSGPRWEGYGGGEVARFLLCDCGYSTPRFRLHRYAMNGLVLGGELGIMRVSVDVGMEFGRYSGPASRKGDTSGDADG